MRFKDFKITKPAFLGDPPSEDYDKYHFSVSKLSDDKSHVFVIAKLSWNPKENAFDFSSVGTRYLEYREDGLEQWLLKWCELKAIEYEYEEQ